MGSFLESGKLIQGIYFIKIKTIDYIILSARIICLLIIIRRILDLQWDVTLLESVDSTNSYAKSLAIEGAKEGTVIIAETQKNGRGRLGRVWDSADGKGYGCHSYSDHLFHLGVC